MKRSSDLPSVILALFSVAATRKWTGPLERKVVPKGRGSGAWLRGSLLGLGLLVAGMGEARGDLVQVVTPASYFLDQYAYANGSNLGDYEYTGVAPGSINNFNSFSSANFSAATNATIGYSTTSTPTSFTANIGFYTAAQASSGIDPSAYGSQAYAVAFADVGGLEITISQPSVATVTWNATNLLGSYSVNSPYANSNSAADMDSFLEIYGGPGASAIADSQLDQNFGDYPTTLASTVLLATSNTGDPSDIETSLNSNTISVDLAPGTYYIGAQSQTLSQFDYANGYFNYPQTGDGGSVTINALPTPEPTSMTLLATGLFAAAGTVVLRTRRKRTGAHDKALDDCLELLRLDPRCAWAYSELKKGRGW